MGYSSNQFKVLSFLIFLINFLKHFIFLVMSKLQHVFITQIKPGKFQEYKNFHDNIYPEVVAGLRQNGVNFLSIYKLPNTNTLVMTIETSWPIDDLSTNLGP